MAVPLGLEHAIHAPGKRPSEERFVRVHHLAERFQVDPGLHPDLMEEVDGILGGDVAGGALHKRAAPEASRGDIEYLHPGFVGGERIGQPQPARVVQMD